MSLRERIGIDLGRKLSVEDGIAWAADNGVAYVDAQIDVAPNALESFDAARCEGVRSACGRHGVHLGRIDSPNLGWSFTVNHASLVPEGIDGFVDAMPMDRCSAGSSTTPSVREKRLSPAAKRLVAKAHVSPGASSPS